MQETDYVVPLNMIYVSHTALCGLEQLEEKRKT